MGDAPNFVFPRRAFVWQSEDVALCLDALTLTAPGCSKLWKCTVLQQKVCMIASILLLFVLLCKNLF